MSSQHSFIKNNYKKLQVTIVMYNPKNLLPTTNLWFYSVTAPGGWRRWQPVGPTLALTHTDSAGGSDALSQ